MNESPEIYAIDYGTTNSLITGASTCSVFNEIPIDQKSQETSILKSIIYTDSRDSWTFGDQAITNYLDNPSHGRVFKSLKRFLPDKLFKGTRIYQEVYTISDLIAKQLRFMRLKANDYFQKDVQSLVLGCPALFSQDSEQNELAYERLKTAASAAGFKNVEFCPEPIAAAHKFKHTLSSEKMVLVADFGGGTSDFTVLKLSNRPFDSNDVLSLGGIPLAGDKYDSSIMRDIISPYFGSRATYKKPMISNVQRFPKALINRLSSPPDIVMLDKNDVLDFFRDAKRYLINKEDGDKLDQLLILIQDRLGYSLFRSIEESKIARSSSDVAKFSYSYPGIEVAHDVTTEEFEKASQTITGDILKTLDATLATAGLSQDDIEIVCLTGGTAYIPQIMAGLKSRFGDKIQTSARFHSVVHGLAERGKSLI